jgi:cellulose synthase/poly-beta-1,6-N-acetylglucosamine synthase-like glycosyltransferase
MKLFFLVLARDEKYVNSKIEELACLGVSFLIVCGKKLDRPNIVYREPKGKFDAINFGFNYVPKDADVVILNDVDSKIRNIRAPLKYFSAKDVALVFAKVSVKEGPQRLFYGLLDFIRRRFLISSSGELMYVRREALKKVLPLKPCKAEDSYILFKVLESGNKAVFCEECCAETSRTQTEKEEEGYKRRTVSGIYQALAYTKPPISIRLFYMLLPIMAPLLLVAGKKGYFWMKGILLGALDYLRGDVSGVWKPVQA